MEINKMHKSVINKIERRQITDFIYLLLPLNKNTFYLCLTLLFFGHKL